MSTVRMTSKLEPPSGRDALAAASVAAWAGSLPPDAQVTAVTHMAGHQRDPYTAFAALVASWSEDRPDLHGARVSGTVEHRL